MTGLKRGDVVRIFIPLHSAEARTAGFRTDSIVMTDNLATVLDRAITAKLGLISGMTPVDTALRHTLGLRIAVANGLFTVP